MSYFSGIPSSKDLQQALREEFEKMQKKSEEFEDVCRKSPLTSGQIVTDPKFFDLVDSILRELDDQNELMRTYERNLETSRQKLDKLAVDKVRIEKAVVDLKSGKTLPDATIRRELCELTLKVNEILFGDLENIRKISPEVRKALYNRELEEHKNKSSKVGMSSHVSDSQEVDLSQPGHQLSSQMTDSEASKTKSELRRAKQDLTRLQTLTDKQKGLLDHLQLHTNDQLIQAEDKIKELMKRTEESDKAFRQLRSTNLDEMLSIQKKLDQESSHVEDLHQKLRSTNDKLKDEKSHSDTLGKKLRAVADERDNEKARAEQSGRNVENVKKELQDMTTRRDDERNRVYNLEKDLRNVQSTRDDYQARVQNMEKDLQAAQSMRDDYQARVQNMEKNLQAAESTRDNFHTQAQNLEKNLRAALSARDSYQAQAQKLEKDLRVARSEGDGHLDRVQRLENDLEVAQSTGDDHLDQVRILEKDLRLVKCDLDNARSLTDALDKKRRTTDELLENLTIDRDNEQARADSLTEVLKQIDITPEDLASLRSEVDELYRLKDLLERLAIRPENLRSLKSTAEEVGDLKDELHNLEEALNDKSSEYDVLSRARDSLAQQVAGQSSQIRHLEGETAQLREQHEKQSDAFNKLEHDLQDKTDAFDKLGGRFQDKSVAFDKLECQLQDKSTEFDKLEHQLQDKSNEIGKLEHQLQDKSVESSSLGSQLQDKSIAFDKLESQFQDKSNAFEKLESEFQDKSNAFDKLESQFQDKSTALDKLESQFQDKSMAFENLNDRFNAKSSEYEEKSIAYDNLSHKLDEMSSSYDILSQERSELSSSHDQLVSDVKTISENLKNKSSEYTRLEQEMQAMVGNLKQQSDETQKLQKSNFELDSSNKSLEAQMKNLKIELQSAHGKITSLGNDVYNAKHHLQKQENNACTTQQEHQRQLAKADDAIKALRDAKEKIQADLVSAQGKVNEGERKAKEAEVARGVLESRISELQKKQDFDLEALSQEKRATFKMRSDRDILQHNLNGLRSQLQNFQKDNAQLKKDADSLRQQYQSTQRVNEIELQKVVTANNANVDGLRGRIVELEETIASRMKQIEISEKETTSATIRANNMKTVFSSYLDRTVGNIPPDYLRGFFNALARSDPPPVVPVQAVSRPFIVQSPREHRQDVSWLREIRPTSLERITQLHSGLWASKGGNSYPPIVFELLRLLTEDFREIVPTGIYYALPYIARAIKKSAAMKRSVDVWLIVMAYRQIHEMCRRILGNSDAEDLIPLLAQSLGGNNPQPDQIVLSALSRVVEAVQAGETYDAIHGLLRQRLHDQMLCTGSKCLATTMEWKYLVMIDIEERKIWIIHKSLAEMPDHTNWPRSVDLRIGSSLAEWPSITLENPGMGAELWWNDWVLNEGRT